MQLGRVAYLATVVRPYGPPPERWSSPKIRHLSERSCPPAHRTLKRRLKETAADPDGIEALAFADLVRTGNARGPAIPTMPKAALPVIAAIPEFLAEADHLLAALSRAAA